MSSLYALLGSRPEASAFQLKHDYERALAAANRSGATKRMVEIVHAYEVLSVPHYRAYYDRTGRAVREERVPGTFGRQVPFRAGPPVLASANVLPSVPDRCLPPEQRHGLRTSRGRWGVLLLFLVFAVASGVAAFVSRQPQHAVAPVVPASSTMQVQALCPAGSFWVDEGTTMTCPDGSAPRWGASRRR